MSEIRVGHGYDVHSLVKGRDLILGGVKIPFERGLQGHSDADVLIHAIMDALLGAAGLSDIGYYFPPNDEKYKDADSGGLLVKVLALVKEKGFDKIINIDATVMAERPKLRPHIADMRSKIASLLDIPVELVNVKATTNEKLGFIGREEGIAAEAVCLIGHDG